MTARASKKIAPLLLSFMLLVACGPAQDTEQPRAGTRNVILFVGDGFGATQMSLGIQYARVVEQRELNIESLMRDGNTGYALTLPFENIDVLLGGGARALIPAGAWVSATLPGIPKDLDGVSKREDENDWVEKLTGEGYVIASDSSSLHEAASHATKLLGVFSASNLPYVIDRVTGVSELLPCRQGSQQTTYARIATNVPSSKSDH